MSGNLQDGMSVKDRIKQLSKERSVVSNGRLSNDERVTRLERIYDHCLSVLEECILRGTMKGTASALLVMEKARLEVVDVERARLSKRGDGSTIRIEFDTPPVETATA